LEFYPTIKDLAKFGGSTLHDWEYSTCVSSNYWNNTENVRKFCDWLLTTHLENDWRNITVKIVVKNGGGGLLAHHFAGSPQKLAEFGGSTYFAWQYKSKVPNRFWQPDG